MTNIIVAFAKIEDAKKHQEYSGEKWIWRDRCLYIGRPGIKLCG